MTAAVRTTTLGMLQGARLILPVKAGERIYSGTIVGIDATGRAVSATATTAIRIVGRAEREADNTRGLDGDIKLGIETSVDGEAYAWMIDQTNPVTMPMLGSLVYCLDNQTVTSLATGRAVVGTLVRILGSGATAKAYVRFLL